MDQISCCIAAWNAIVLFDVQHCRRCSGLPNRFHPYSVSNIQLGPASQNRDDNNFTVRVPHTKTGLITFMLIGASIPYSRCL